jgi:hypothetical protein
MATLRITFAIVRNQWTPTFYSLQGAGEDPIENTYYYNVSRVMSDIQYYEQCVLYCARKIDFSGMADHEVKNVKGVGAMVKITHEKDPTASIAMSANALQCITWGEHLLVNCSPYNINSDKQKLPQYMLASDLAQLKENVLFHVLWGDNDPKHSQDLTTKFMDITLNLFVE